MIQLGLLLIGVLGLATNLLGELGRGLVAGACLAYAGHDHIERLLLHLLRPRRR